MRGVEPVFHKSPALRLETGAFALGNFVFVMGKHEILAAEMKIEARPQKLHAHGAALDMPPGPAFAPRAGPGYLAVFSHARFPESKIGDSFLLIFITPHAFTNSAELAFGGNK